MKTAEGQALASAALERLVTIIKLDAMLERIHSQDDLIKAFNGLLWDQKVFSVPDATGTSWACEIFKDGPTLAIRPKRHDVVDQITITGSAFWKQLIAVLQARHPNLRLSGTTTFFERVLHDSGIEQRLAELAPTRARKCPEL